MVIYIGAMININPTDGDLVVAVDFLVSAAEPSLVLLGLPKDVDVDPLSSDIALQPANMSVGRLMWSQLVELLA
jgi:hypothetical protein